MTAKSYNNEPIARSSIATPWDSKIVISLSVLLPLILPVIKSESVFILSQEVIPIFIGCIKSPHSILAWSILSVTIVDALEIVSLSISLFVETFDPAALIWVPGFIHFDENTGESEFVMVVIM